MARQKRASDDVYNARRRIRRAAARAEKRGESERARQLRELARQTYVSKSLGKSVADAARAAVAALQRAQEPKQGAKKDEARAQLVRALRNVAGRPTMQRGARQLYRSARADITERRNRIMAIQINLASQDLPSSLDTPELSGKSQARIFWMSTRKIWQGVPVSKRYEAIMRALGTDSLAEAFDMVLAYNRKAMGMAEDAERKVRDTLRDMGDERGDEPVTIGSPPEFMYFVRDASNLLREIG